MAIMPLYTGDTECHFNTDILLVVAVKSRQMAVTYFLFQHSPAATYILFYLTDDLTSCYIHHARLLLYHSVAVLFRRMLFCRRCVLTLYSLDACYLDSAVLSRPLFALVMSCDGLIGNSTNK